ncbi:MAG: response regulator [Anaerolineales bacterium]|nr:response regulator [Anaerolineales bacterium]
MATETFKILYVEDTIDNRILVRRVLQAEGYTVLEAGTAQEGLELAITQRPDLILVDINLPEVDGLTLTTHLKSDPDFSLVPIVALTANVMRGDRERSLAAGCDGYIQKPIDIDLLPLQIARFLNNRE